MLSSSSSSLSSSSASTTCGLKCWKCNGLGQKYHKNKSSKHQQRRQTTRFENQQVSSVYDGKEDSVNVQSKTNHEDTIILITTCTVCDGKGYRVASVQSQKQAQQPGTIQLLRGYPTNHPLRQRYPNLIFAGPPAVVTIMHSDDSADGDDSSADASSSESIIPTHLLPNTGEIVAALGCGNWRIYQLQNGNKMTVDDFICSYLAATEMLSQGWGPVKEELFIHSIMDKATSRTTTATTTSHGDILLGGVSVEEAMYRAKQQKQQLLFPHYFTHVDLGTGCGSVLMTLLWAFLGQIQSIGIEAQDISYHCLQRALQWNLGTQQYQDLVHIHHGDFRELQGEHRVGKVGVDDDNHDESPMCYDLITGTPPYFPLSSFVASPNHDQKVQCRIPTRGSASDYLETASKYLKEDTGVFCMVEAAFPQAEQAILDTAKKCGMVIKKRLDVIPREGLPVRFSGWVFTKQSKSCCHSEELLNSSSGTTLTFPIETLILRNADLTRSVQYSAAMESMGWVDFETYRA